MDRGFRVNRVNRDSKVNREFRVDRVNREFRVVRGFGVGDGGEVRGCWGWLHYHAPLQLRAVNGVWFQVEV